MKRFIPLVATFAAILVFNTAQAGFLGHTVRATAYFPDLPPAANVIGGPVDAVVGGGVEFLDGQFGAFFGPSFDFADSTVTITHAQSGHQSGTFNGYEFNDLLGTIDPIVGVSILFDSTGFFSGDPSRVSFDADNLWVNFESLDFDQQPDPRIILGVEFGDGMDIPEPATLALFGLGLAGLGVARRKKRA